MSLSKVRPLGNRILVKREEPKASKGGILLPESSKEKPKQGKVIAIGPGKMDEHGNLEKMQIKVGDKVIVGGHTGTIESISLRCLYLRHGSGALHSIPFSEVKDLINFSFGYLDKIMLFIFFFFIL